MESVFARRSLAGALDRLENDMRISEGALGCLLILIAYGCATPGSRGDKVLPRARQVKLFGPGDDLSGCRQIRRVTMRDGFLGESAAAPRDGDVERLIARLKHRVVRAGGNAARIDKRSTSLVLDRPGAGTVERIEATIFACPDGATGDDAV